MPMVLRLEIKQRVESVRKLAARLGLSKSTVQKYRSGSLVQKP